MKTNLLENQSHQPKNKQHFIILSSLAVLGMIACFCLFGKYQEDPQFLLMKEQIEEDLFRQWMLAHGVTYNDLETEQYRFRIFKKNFQLIREHNAKNEPYTMALNKFADLTQEEFSAMYLGYKHNSQRQKNIVNLPIENLPSSVNWTNAGAVTPVKNQDMCGSCWAFSATGALEGLNFIANKKLLSFSEQQLVDCSKKFGNQGCNGGEMDAAFQYVEQNGIELEDTYPYKGKTGLLCKYNAKNVVFKNKNHVDVKPNSVEDLMAAVAQQPVSVAVEADQPSWQFYSGGVLTGGCGQKLDHGVLVVGYDTDSKGRDFWIVKNSWGNEWGIQGYIWIARSDANLCGVLSEPSYPTL